MKQAFAILGILEIVVVSVIAVSNFDQIAEITHDFVKGWYMLPVAGFLFVEQIEYFLEHDFEIETASFSSDDLHKQLVGNLKNLVDIYRKSFAGSKMLIAEHTPKSNCQMRGTPFNGVTRSQRQSCKEPQILDILVEQLTGAGISSNVNYQSALISLINGQSISVRDYISGEFLIYLCSYMNYYMAQGDTFLILCTNSEDAEDIRESIEECMTRINKVCAVWQIAGLKEAEGLNSMNVLICSYQELISHELLAKRGDFFKMLKMVVIDKSAEFCAQGNVQKDMLFSELRRISKVQQYVFMTEIETSIILSSLSHYINTEIIPYKSDISVNNVDVLIWAEESCYRAQQKIGIGTDMSNYIGVSLTLALVGVKYQFPSIHIFASKNKPLRSYEKALTSNQQNIRAYLQRELNLKHSIHINDYNSLNTHKNLDMMILYDAQFNLFNTLWFWLKYGGKDSTLVHIVSPPYMLRDYFALNMDTLINNEADYSPLISWRSGLDRSRFQALLLEMANSGMTQEEIMKKNDEYGWEYPSVRNLLEAAINSVLMDIREAYGITQYFSFRENTVFDVDQNKYVKTTVIRLVDANIRKELIRQTAFAKLARKNSGVTEEIPILRDNQLNYYLRDQKISLNGTLQNIVSIEDGIVHTEETQKTNSEQYYQICDFEIRDSMIVDQCVDSTLLDFNIYQAKQVKRNIRGYYYSDREINFCDKQAMKVQIVFDRHSMNLHDEKMHIEELKRNIQILQIQIPRSEIQPNPESVMQLMAFMLKEIFKTLFPDSYMNLYVLTEYTEPEDYWKRFFFEQTNNMMEMEELIHSIVPFTHEGPKNPYDSSKDHADFISLYILEYSSVELGMITNIYTHRKKIFQIMKNYLEWYMSYYSGTRIEENDTAPQTDSSDSGYLHLGFSTVPDCFDIQSLYNLCDRCLPQLKSNSDITPNPIEVNAEARCTFCGRPLIYSYEFSDNRRACLDCEQQIVDQENEIRELYQVAVDNMKDHYNLQLYDTNRVKLRFASAAAIRKKVGFGDSICRVLGFYDWKKKSLWIEARGPRNTVIDTLFHELTHLWQYEDKDVWNILKKMSAQQRLELMEGHACYVQIECMRNIGQYEYAEIYERELIERNDEYGRGYNAIKQYLDELAGEGTHNNPFVAFKKMLNVSGDNDE